MDFFIDRLIKQATLEHIKFWDDGVCTNDKIKARDFTTWIFVTESLFRNYPAIKIISAFEDIIEKVSNEEYEKGIYKKMEKSVAIREGIKRNPRVKGVVRKEIDKRIKITEVAKQFGLDPDSKGKIHCPFHADGNPSCYLNDDKNIFHCFGCDAKGDIIEFYRRLKEIPECVRNAEKEMEEMEKEYVEVINGEKRRINETPGCR